MLAMIALDYNAADGIKKLSREEYNHVSNSLPQFSLGLWEEGKEMPTIYFYGQQVLIDLVEDGAMLTKLGIQFTVKNFKNAYKAASVEHNGSTYNLSVHVPNVGLLALNEVMVLEDACTDSLQRHLDDEWRIVAVCPPNGVRRPDYILGRTKK